MHIGVQRHSTDIKREKTLIAFMFYISTHWTDIFIYCGTWNKVLSLFDLCILPFWCCH